MTAGTAPVNGRGGSGAANIAGLTELMQAFGHPLPFIGGNLLLGGAQRRPRRKKGDDLIDGAPCCECGSRGHNPLTPGGPASEFVDSPVDLVNDVFSDPQRLNPGNITSFATSSRAAERRFRHGRCSPHPRA